MLQQKAKISRNRISVLGKAEEMLSTETKRRESRKTDPDDNGRDDTRSSNDPSCKFCRLETYLHRVRMSQVVFGMYYRRRQKPDGAGNDNIASSCCSSTSGYNIAILIALWANCVRSIMSIWVGNEDRSMDSLRITVAVWTFQACVSVTVMLKASHPKFGHQEQLCQFWREQILPKFSGLNIEMTTPSFMNAKLTICMIVCWACVVVNVCSVGLTFFLHFGTMSDLMTPLFVSPLPIHTLTKVLIIIVHLFNSVAWLGPMLYYGILSTVLNTAFSTFSIALQKEIKEQPDNYPRRLQDYRVLHLDLSRAVEIVNQDLQYLYANWYGTYIPLACFILYSMVNNSMDFVSMFVHVFWFGTGIVCILVVSAFAASLHDTAHSQLDFMYDLCMKDASLEQLGHVQLFLAKLTSNSTGYTVMNFVMVTKELILTVAGLYLTYFLFLLQF